MMLTLAEAAERLGKKPRRLKFCWRPVSGKRAWKLSRQNIQGGDFPDVTSYGLIGIDFDRDCLWFAKKPWHLWYIFLDNLFLGYVYILRWFKYHGFLLVPEGGSAIDTAKKLSAWNWNPWREHPDNFYLLRKHHRR